MRVRRVSLWASSILSSLLAACGGGGGAGDSKTEESAPPASPPSFTRSRGFDQAVVCLARAGDGSGDLYVGGAFTTCGSAAAGRIARLNADGTADTAFAAGSGFNMSVWTVAPAGDGSGDVYVGGDFTSYNGTPVNRIVRLNSDGSIDPAFAIGSGVDETSYEDTVRAIVPAGDGSGDIYVGGFFPSYNGTSVNHIVRVNSDGSIDPAFASGIGNPVRAIAPAGDGSGDIYVGGQFNSYKGQSANYFVRINSDGTKDDDFVLGGGFNNYVDAIAPAGDGTGDVYVGGWFRTYNGAQAETVARLNSNGTLDLALAPGTGGNDAVTAIVPAGDGSGDVYVGGLFTSFNGTAVGRLVRLNSNGSIDPAFAAGAGCGKPVNAILSAQDGSGDVFVGGNFLGYDGIGYDRLVRVNSDGTPDPGIPAGSGFDHLEQWSHVYSIAAAEDGSGDLYVGGYFDHYDGAAAKYIARLNPDGTFDPAFATGSGFNTDVYVARPAGDGSGDVYVGGGFTSYQGAPANRIVRLNSDGTRDAGFAVGGGFDGYVTAIAPIGGDVYVGGYFTSYDGTPAHGIVRLNSDGTVDGGFAAGSGFDDGVDALAPAGDGDLYAGGSFANYAGVPTKYIVRLHSDGSVDGAFSIGSSFDTEVYALLSVGDGDLYVGGEFESYNGTPIGGFVRLDSDGTIDPAFPSVLKFGAVNVVVPATDAWGGVYLGGSFGSYGPRTADRILRLGADGSVY